MNTEQLINAITADNVTRRPYLSLFVLSVAFAVAADALLFVETIGPRPDFAAAAGTWRYLFKFVVTISLAAPATMLTYRLSAPAMWNRSRFRMLLLPPCLLMIAAALELCLLPRSLWMVRTIGSNSLSCMSFIPVLSILPLVCLFALLRRGAPCDGGLAGAIAGLAASSIAATFYALNCFDDSPLFVITWYPIAVAIVVMAGYLAGRRLLVW